MSDRVLRGSRLGTSSYEDDREIAPAPRQSITYECPEGHRVELPFSAEAEIPPAWECPRCGANAIRLDADQPEAKHAKPPRTHWDMLLERRSLSDLEDLLSERLQLLRSGEIGPPQIGEDADAATKSDSASKSGKSGSAGSGGAATSGTAAKKASASKSTAATKNGSAAKSGSGAKDTGAKDTGAKDTGAKDSGAKDSGSSKSGSSEGLTSSEGSGGGKHRKSA